MARYSGKEFAAALPEFDVLAARNIAESIRMQILNMNKRATDYALKVLTVSCGICTIPIFSQQYQAAGGERRHGCIFREAEGEKRRHGL